MPNRNEITLKYNADTSSALQALTKLGQQLDKALEVGDIKGIAAIEKQVKSLQKTLTGLSGTIVKESEDAAKRAKAAAATLRKAQVEANKSVGGNFRDGGFGYGKTTTAALQAETARQAQQVAAGERKRAQAQNEILKKVIRDALKGSVSGIGAVEAESKKILKELDGAFDGTFKATIDTLKQANKSNQVAVRDVTDFAAQGVRTARAAGVAGAQLNRASRETRRGFQQIEASAKGFSETAKIATRSGLGAAKSGKAVTKYVKTIQTSMKGIDRNITLLSDALDPSNAVQMSRTVRRKHEAKLRELKKERERMQSAIGDGVSEGALQQAYQTTRYNQGRRKNQTRSADAVSEAQSTMVKIRNGMETGKVGVFSKESPQMLAALDRLRRDRDRHRRNLGNEVQGTAEHQAAQIAYTQARSQHDRLRNEYRQAETAFNAATGRKRPAAITDLEAGMETIHSTTRRIGIDQKGGAKANALDTTIRRAAVRDLDRLIAESESALSAGALNKGDAKTLTGRLATARAMRDAAATQEAEILKRDAAIDAKSKKQAETAAKQNTKRIDKAQSDTERAKSIGWATSIVNRAADANSLRGLKGGELRDLHRDMAEANRILNPVLNPNKRNRTAEERAERDAVLQSIGAGNMSAGRRLLQERKNAVGEQADAKGRPNAFQSLWFNMTGRKTGDEQYGRADSGLMHKANKLTTRVGGLAGVSLYGLGVPAAVGALTTGALDASTEAEGMKNTLGGLVNQFATFRDMRGKAIEGEGQSAEKFTKSLEYASKLYGDIRKRATESILTTKELFDYVLAGAPQLLQKGLNADQSIDIVDKVASLGKGMGLQPTAVMSDIRDLANGQVTVRSQVLRAMGFDAAGLKKGASEGGDGLKKYFDRVFKNFEPAFERLKTLGVSQLAQFVDRLQQVMIVLGNGVAKGMLAPGGGLDRLGKNITAWAESGDAEKFGRSLGDLADSIIQSMATIVKVASPFVKNLDAVLGTAIGGLTTFVGVQFVLGMEGVKRVVKLASLGWTEMLSKGAFIRSQSAFNGFALGLMAVVAALEFAASKAKEAAKDIGDNQDNSMRRASGEGSTDDQRHRETDRLRGWVTKAGFDEIDWGIERSEEAQKKVRSLEGARQFIQQQIGGEGGGFGKADWSAGVLGLSRDSIRDALRSSGADADVISRFGEGHGQIYAGEAKDILKEYQDSVENRGGDIPYKDRLALKANAIRASVTGGALKGVNISAQSNQGVIANYERVKAAGGVSAEAKGDLQSRLLDLLSGYRRDDPSFVKPLDALREAMKGSEVETARLTSALGNLENSIKRMPDEARAGGRYVKADMIGERTTLELRKARQEALTSIAKIEDPGDRKAGNEAFDAAVMRYSQTQEQLRVQQEEQLRSLREAIIAQREETDLKRANNALARQEMELQRKSNALDNLGDDGIFAQGVGNARLRLLTDQGRLAAGHSGLEGRRIDNQIGAEVRKGDTIDDVARFFGDLKVNGLPPLKFDPATIKELSGEVDKTLAKLNGPMSGLARSIDATAPKTDALTGALNGLGEKVDALAVKMDGAMPATGAPGLTGSLGPMAITPGMVSDSIPDPRVAASSRAGSMQYALDISDKTLGIPRSLGKMILDAEGGEAGHDQGGTTKWGINTGYDGLTADQVRALTPAGALSIYANDYFKKSRGGKGIPAPKDVKDPALQAVLFDTGVNPIGHQKGKDAIPGSIWDDVRSILAQPISDREKAVQIIAARRTRYRASPQKEYIGGWLGRMDRLSTFIGATPGETTAIPVDQAKVASLQEDKAALAIAKQRQMGEDKQKAFGVALKLSQTANAERIGRIEYRGSERAGYRNAGLTGGLSQYFLQNANRAVSFFDAQRGKATDMADRFGAFARTRREAAFGMMSLNDDQRDRLSARLDADPSNPAATLKALGIKASGPAVRALEESATKQAAASDLIVKSQYAYQSAIERAASIQARIADVLERASYALETRLRTLDTLRRIDLSLYGETGPRREGIELRGRADKARSDADAAYDSSQRDLSDLNSVRALLNDPRLGGLSSGVSVADMVGAKTDPAAYRRMFGGIAANAGLSPEEAQFAGSKLSAGASREDVEKQFREAFGGEKTQNLVNALDLATIDTDRFRKYLDLSGSPLDLKTSIGRAVEGLIVGMDHGRRAADMLAKDLESQAGMIDTRNSLADERRGVISDQARRAAQRDLDRTMERTFADQYEYKDPNDAIRQEIEDRLQSIDDEERLRSVNERLDMVNASIAVGNAYLATVAQAVDRAQNPGSPIPVLPGVNVPLGVGMGLPGPVTAAGLASLGLTPASPDAAIPATLAEAAARYGVTINPGDSPTAVAGRLEEAMKNRQFDVDDPRWVNRINGVRSDVAGRRGEILANQREKRLSGAVTSFLGGATSNFSGTFGSAGGFMSAVTSAASPFFENDQRLQGMRNDMAIRAMSGKLGATDFNAIQDSGLGHGRTPGKAALDAMRAGGSAGKAAQMRFARTQAGFAAMDMGGAMVGQYLGRAVGGDPAKVDMGSQFGGMLGSSGAIFGGLGAWAGPVGMVAGGLLGGLFGKRKHQDDQRENQHRQRVEQSLSNIDRSLRPVGGYFESLRGEALFGRSSRYLGNRYGSGLRLQMSLGGRV